MINWVDEAIVKQKKQEHVFGRGARKRRFKKEMKIREVNYSEKPS